MKRDDYLTYNWSVIEGSWPELVREGPLNVAPRDGSEAKRIIAEVAEKHRVSVEDIKSNMRVELVVRARHAAIYALRDAFPNWSLNQIASRVGLADHTTVLHALKNRGKPRKEASYANYVMAKKRAAGLLADTKPKLTPDKARAMREARAAGARNVDLAAQYGMAPTSVWAVVSRRNWKDTDNIPKPKNANFKLTADQVREIREVCANGGDRKKLAQKYGINVRHISAIHLRRTWKHVD